MSHEQILDMVKQSQDLVNGSIISNDLNSILIGFCDLINHQNDEIDKLRQKVEQSEKEKGEMEIMKKNFEGKAMLIDQLQNQFAILANQTQSELIRSRQEIETYKVQINDRIGASMQKISDVGNLAESQIRTLTLQNNHSEEKLKKNIEELAKQNENLDFNLHEIKIQLNTFIQEQKQSQLEIPILVEKEKQSKQNNESIDSSIIDDIKHQISLIDEKVEQYQNEISEVHSSSQKFIQEIKNSEKKIQKFVEEETTSLSNRVSSLEKQFESVPEIQDLIFSGKDIGLKPILQAVMRDSRRLDSFDQQVSSVRIECENVASAMVALSQTVSQFNHQLFDFGIEVKNNSNKIVDDVVSIRKFCKSLGKTVTHIISDISRISDGHHHLTSTIILSNDEISHLITLATGRKLKTNSLFDEINLEASDLSTDFAQKKVNLDMEKQIKLLEGQDIEAISDEKLKKIQIPHYQKVIKPYKASKTILSDNDDGVHSIIQENNMNPLIFTSLEELRVKVNDIGDILVVFKDSVNTKFEDMHKEIKRKMDSDNIDRIIIKMQNVLKRIQNEIDEIKLRKHPFSFAPANQYLNKNVESDMNSSINRIGSSKTYNNDNIALCNSISESRLISSSVSVPIRSTQSSVMTRPSTAVPASIMSKKLKKNQNELQRKSRNQDLNNSIPLIQKASSGKLASSVVSNPKDYK